MRRSTAFHNMPVVAFGEVLNTYWMWSKKSFHSLSYDTVEWGRWGDYKGFNIGRWWLRDSDLEVPCCWYVLSWPNSISSAIKALSETVDELRTELSVSKWLGFMTQKKGIKKIVQERHPSGRCRKFYLPWVIHMPPMRFKPCLLVNTSTWSIHLIHRSMLCIERSARYNGTL